MKRTMSVIATLVLLLGITVPTTVLASSNTTIPTFSIIGVVQDKTVTIQTENFPANDSFTVTMGVIGTQGVDGSVIGTTDSGNGGSFQETYNIPPSLTGAEQISIRLQSPTSGFFAYNWFWNATASGTVAPTPTPTPTTPPSSGGSSVFPTFSITGVVQDKTVTIAGKNFPANDTFTVTMGAFGTQGVNGTEAGTTNSGAGGNITATYNIPASLAGSDMIAIRLQSPTSGYFAYNWFWNTTATVTPSP